ncbi:MULTISPECIES: hypothetical protein [Pseudoalteromonas]|uniref:hypothetical protein n=1 Tax=Pseudoalteromonas TaxID=53246 RepID=UPI00186726BF|nr:MULTISPECIES: hypothetical protein [Pseudoalteromonas]
MNASQSAWHRGKVDYKLGVAYQDNPYQKLDTDLADYWQMASYQERQSSITKSIN